MSDFRGRFLWYELLTNDPKAAAEPLRRLR